MLAQALVERIADERGWTTDELADRTIPTAGLDERGILDLEIGSRLYQARLDAEDVLTLYNPDGKVVKSLPAGQRRARQGERRGSQEGALQRQEGIEAGSRIPGQAVVRSALCRAALAACRSGNASCLSTRSSGGWCSAWSGSVWTSKAKLSGRSGRSRICPSPTAATMRSILRLSLVSGWRTVLCSRRTKRKLETTSRRLQDRNAVQPTGSPGAGERGGTCIDDRAGHIIEAFKLRSAAQKLGYERAQAEDGGWFTQYIKPFAGIGINAVIEFTGSPLPEENRAVALIETKFVRARKGQRSGYGSQIALTGGAAGAAERSLERPSSDCGSRQRICRQLAQQGGLVMEQRNAVATAPSAEPGSPTNSRR